MAVDDVRRCAEAAPLLLVDAAYADFDPDVDLTPLVHEYDNIVLSRTFSKAYCLAGLRVGYDVGDIAVLDYVDRFLVPGSSISSAALHAGLAALEDEEHHRHQVERIRRERGRVLEGLRALGLHAFDSRGNFVAIDGSDRPGGAHAFAAAVREHGIVIRLMDERLARITIGRAEENDRLLAAAATAASAP
jgi:histidinol-phosphate aminotransferase